MSRLYVFESTPTSTGAKADHRLPMRASSFDPWTRFIASSLGIFGQNAGTWTGDSTKYSAPLLSDLQSHKGSSIVIAGDHQPPTPLFT
jgi:molybdopterin-containing oxidoreductase family iron-sulfur binding subunit